MPYLRLNRSEAQLRLLNPLANTIRETEYLLQCSTGLTGWDAENPQGLLYLNGEMTQGLDLNHTEAFLAPDTEYQAHVYLYTGVVKGPFPFEVRLLRCYTEVDGLYYDILTPLEALEYLNENTSEYKSILTALEKAVNLVDTRQVYSEAYFASIRAARAYLEEEFYSKICTPEGKPVVHCIGHTHIDMEWMWARAQTREKIQRSFATANALMERYPEYLFTLTQPELYRYLKEEAPEKYDQLKAWVEKQYLDSRISQNIWLYSDSRRVDFENTIQWHNQHQVLKVAFPLDVHAVEANDGDLADCFSLVSCDRENIILDTVKKAEADNGMIVRLYDSFDMRTTAKITVAEGFTKACLCDIMENEQEALPFDGRTVTLPVKNFEIVTLKFIP